MDKRWLIFVCFLIALPMVEATSFSNGYNYQTNYTVSNFQASMTGALLTINASNITAFKCKTELIQDDAGNNISFYRNGCNATPNSNVLYFLKMPSSATANITFYSGNTTPVTDKSVCDITVSTFCDNFATISGWANGITQQSTYAIDNYGWYVINAYPYKTSNLSTAGILPTRILWNFYGYNSSANPNYYFGTKDIAGATYNLLFRVQSSGQLQYCGWLNIAGIFFSLNQWNILLTDYDSSGNFNVTLINSTGSYSSNGLSLTAACHNVAADEAEISVGEDTASYTAFGSNLAIFNFTKTAFAYNGTFIPGTPATPTNTTLYINSVSANATQTYNPYITDNITSVINVTGLYLELYRNGTLIDNATSVSYNISNYGVGFYNLTAYYSGNVTYAASKMTLWLNVSQNQSTCSLSFNPVSPITYNASFIPSCSCLQPEGSTKLYQNGTDKTASNNTNLYYGSGDYNFTCNATNTQNYTNATANSNYLINPDSASQSVYFNTSSLVYLTIPVNVTCNSSKIMTLDIYKSGSLVTNPYIETSLISGVYNFSCNTSNGNYTGAIASKNLVVYPPPSNISSASNISVMYDIASLTPNNMSCADNKTLWEYYQEPNISRYIACPNGCDSIDNQCDPPVYQEYLIILGIIAFIVIALIVIARLLL